MSKKQLRAALADKQSEIERLQKSLTAATQGAADSNYRLQEAMRSDQMAAQGPLKTRAQKDQQSVEDIKRLLQERQAEAEDIQTRLKAE